MDGYAGYNRVLDLLRNVWQCDNKDLHQRLRFSKSDWITLKRKCRPNLQQGRRASLIETCNMNKFEPHSYLTDVLTAIVMAINKSTSNTC